MAEETSDRWDAPADAPSEPQITVTFFPRSSHHLIRQRLASIRVLAEIRALVALALVAAALAAITERARPAARTSAPSGARARHVRDAAPAPDAGPAGIAAAYGPPVRCLRITIAASNPTYARAHVDRRSACARYHGYVNASFHWIGGAWRLVLDEGQLFVPNDLLAPCGAPGTAPPPRRCAQSAR